ncbi:hypothetical protein M5D96_002684 [Drosophila gunungcola]|uniref:Uncharacterized protein n=1 Tax=Drosophila gunungcola TaxID=103775 RepID=A0A9Q0BWN0_9MUSC|nr:hypothetical protein M5D96_002684 [Drosophila gunungcola]
MVDHLHHAQDGEPHEQTEDTTTVCQELGHAVQFRSLRSDELALLEIDGQAGHLGAGILLQEVGVALSQQHFLQVEVGLRDLRVVDERCAGGHAVAGRFHAPRIPIPGIQSLHPFKLPDQQLSFRPIVAMDLILSAHGHIHVPRHGELHAPAFGQREVGQTLQLAVGFGVDLEEAQRPLVAEKALPPNRMVFRDSRRHGDHAGLHCDQHLLAHGNAHELLGHLRHIVGCMEQHLVFALKEVLGSIAWSKL